MFLMILSYPDFPSLSPNDPKQTTYCNYAVPKTALDKCQPQWDSDLLYNLFHVDFSGNGVVSYANQLL